jgi:hypothetical protein
MGLRRRNFVKDDDCFAIFEESAPAGVDTSHAAESAAVKVEALTNAGPAPGEGYAANPPSPERPSKKPFRCIQFAFGEDCFYVDLSNRTLLPHEAETILQQREAFYWAKDRQDLPWIHTNWQDVAKFNPLQKTYRYGDEQSAAEDMAFAIFDVWKFPVDWPWHVTAAAFHAGYIFEQGRPLPTNDPPGPMHATDAVFRVLKHRRDEEVSIAVLTAAAIDAGWRPRSKNPRLALGAALRNEIKQRGDRARYVRGTRRGTWRLSAAGLRHEDEEDIMARFMADPAFHESFRRLMDECDAEEDDDEGLGVDQPEQESSVAEKETPDA